MSRTPFPRTGRALRSGLLPFLLFLALSAGWAGGPPALHGQTPDREALLASARSEFDDAAALELLVRAADPSLAPPDSLWAVTLHDLAFTLIRMGDEAAAELWLRYAARHASEWPLDREWFPPAVATLWDRARLDVGSGDDDPDAHSTVWDWEGASAAGASGKIRLADEAAPPGATVLLARPGEEPVPAGPGADVEAGSYRVSVTAEGYEPLHLDREVLPGVRTFLDVDLVRSLSEAARQEALGRTATIRWGVDGEGCTNGVVVGDGRSVLTSLRGLGSRSGLTVEAGADHSFVNVPVVRTDVLLDLALLRLEGVVSGLEQSTPAEGSRHGWVALGGGCDDGGTTWTRLEAVGSGAGAPWSLQPDLASAALGAPLMHPDGGLLGIVTGVDRAVPLELAGPLILGPFATEEAPVLGSTTIQRSGIPWKWIGAGVGLAGIGAAIAAGSGGGGGGDGPPAPGTVVITFPGG